MYLDLNMNISRFIKSQSTNEELAVSKIINTIIVQA